MGAACLNPLCIGSDVLSKKALESALSSSLNPLCIGSDVLSHCSEELADLFSLNPLCIGSDVLSIMLYGNRSAVKS